jgi:hypothetical protein
MAPSHIPADWFNEYALDSTAVQKMKRNESTYIAMITGRWLEACNNIKQHIVLVLRIFVKGRVFQFLIIWIRRAERLDMALLRRFVAVLLRQMASTLIVIIERAIVTTLAASGTSVIS